MIMDSNLQRSPLHEQHIALGARMVPFAGWEMPVQYTGIQAEHKAVRESLGVFDISHMGQVFVSGPDLATVCNWLNSVLSSNVAQLQPGEGQYSMLLNAEGGIIDDLIVYRQDGNSYFLVVNASKTSEDVAWLESQVGSADIRIANRSSEFAAMAVQGPQTEQAAADLFPSGVVLPARFCMTEFATDSGTVIVCRTGYTGEDGVELFCPVADAAQWWQNWVQAGATPAGLGARDTLRLEKCYPLNGNDLSPEHTPLQAGLSFAVDLKKGPFIGRDALLQQKSDGLPSRLVALRQLDRSPPPRPGYQVYAGEQNIGQLCSGGMSPTLSCGISLAYVPTDYGQIGTVLDVEIRGKRYPAQVVRKPFV